MKLLDYITGSRKGADAHSVEYQAMSDPFLADAIDGYDSVNADHLIAISNMQAYVSAQAFSHKKDSNVWKIAIVATLFIAILGGYFTLMNHKSTMLVAQEQNSSYINLYVPESYVQQKGLELSETQKTSLLQGEKSLAVSNISNLDEVIKPINRIEIYVPASYYAQLNKADEKELALLSSNTLQQEKSVNNNKELYAEAVIETQKQEPGASSLSVPILAMETVAEPTAKPSLSHQNSDLALVSDAYLSENAVGKVAESMSDVSQTIEKPEVKGRLELAMKDGDDMLSGLAVASYDVDYQSSKNRSASKMSSSEVMSKKKIVRPKPVNGESQYKTYIKENMVAIFDPACKEATTYGTVVLTFNVTRQGRPTDIAVEQGLCEPYNKEAIRLLKEGPDWTYSSERGELKIYFQQE